MAYRSAKVKIVGSLALLMNNPQCVDRFNPLAKKMAEINAKRTRRTDEDYHELADLEMEAKTYFDEDGKLGNLGVYVPSRWLMAAMCKVSNKVCKVSKADVRAGVTIVQENVSLQYEGQDKVKGIADIVKVTKFRHRMLLPQGQNRLAKTGPIFHGWSFTFDFEFEDTIFDKQDITRILEYAALRGGFGDFRPSFGRAIAEVTYD